MCKAFGNYTYEKNGSVLHKLQRALSGPNFIWRKPLGSVRAYSLGGEDQRHVDEVHGSLAKAFFCDTQLPHHTFTRS